MRSCGGRLVNIRSKVSQYHVCRSLSAVVIRRHNTDSVFPIADFFTSLFKSSACYVSGIKWCHKSYHQIRNEDLHQHANFQFDKWSKTVPIFKLISESLVLVFRAVASQVVWTQWILLHRTRNGRWFHNAETLYNQPHESGNEITGRSVGLPLISNT